MDAIAYRGLTISLGYKQGMWYPIIGQYEFDHLLFPTKNEAFRRGKELANAYLED